MTAACLKNAGQGAGGEQVDPQEITRRNMDQSQALRDMISGNFGGNWVRHYFLKIFCFVWFVVDYSFPPRHNVLLMKSLRKFRKTEANWI